MKLCVLFPNTNKDADASMVKLFKNMFTMEGWNVITEKYSGYDDPGKMLRQFNTNLKSSINDKDTTAVLFIGIGYGAFWAYQVARLHGEAAALVNPIMDPTQVLKLDMFNQTKYQEMMYASSLPVQTMSLLTRDTIVGNTDELTLFEIGSMVKLLGSDCTDMMLAHHIESFSEDVTTNNSETFGVYNGKNSN